MLRTVGTTLNVHPKTNALITIITVILYLKFVEIKRSDSTAFAAADIIKAQVTRARLFVLKVS